MTAMSCAEAEDLLGAYALDALPEDEARRVEEHLRGCGEHRATAAELRRTSALLPLTVEEHEPSPDLRGRIIAAVRATPMSSAPAEKQRVAGEIVPLGRAGRAPGWSRRSARLAVAAAVVLALGIGGVIGYQIGQLRQAEVAYTFQGDPTTAPGAEARLVYFKDNRQSVVAVSGLPHLASGQVYEMWLINNGVAVDKGISISPNGNLTAQVSGDVTQFQQFAITIEPGEQRLPTTKPILVGNLSTSST